MISVCMATFNGEKFIKEQLDSILDQLDENDEIIISDDGSSDGTCDYILSLNDDRIKLIYNDGTHGFTHNFENALKNASGQFIILSDQDDIWVDNKVSIIMEELKNNDFVVSDCITIDENKNIIQKSRFKEFDIKPGFIRHLIKSRFLGCCMAFNKKVLEAALPFPKNDFLIEHDIWLAAVSFLYFRYKLIDIPLIYYRRHDSNVSSGGFSKGYSPIIKLKKRVYRIYKLMQMGNKVKNIKSKDNNN